MIKELSIKVVIIGMKKYNLRLPNINENSIENKSLTDRPSNVTDRLIENYSVCESQGNYSFNNLLTQVTPVELLYLQRQNTQKKHLHTDVSLKNEQIRELSLRFNELTRENAKLRRTNESLTVQNSDLQQSLVASERQRQSLKKKLSSKEFPLFGNSNQTSEILNYGNFLNKRLRESPRIQQIILDRVDSIHSYAEQLSNPEQTQNCLLQTLQILSDLLVEDIVKTSKACNKPSQTSVIRIFKETTEEPAYSPIYANRSTSFLSREAEEDQDTLLCSINEQSQRIAKLNQQISAAMKSSRQLLYSPLQPRTKEHFSK